MRRFGLVVVVVLLLLLSGCTAVSETYPAKPVQLVILDAPGGPTDILARALVESAKPHFPQPIVPLNRPGGAGTIAAAEVVQAAPDGYTIGLQAVGPMALQPHRNELPYKTVDDYRPVINLVRQPLVFAVPAGAPWRDMAEVIAFAKASPGKVRIGIPGAGTIAQVNLDLLAEASGAAFTVVPFPGANQTVTALLGAQIDAAVVGPPALIGPVRAGSLRVLGVFEEDRDLAFPAAPTFRELGYDITLGGYFFVIAPKDTPADVVRTMHGAFRQATESEDFRRIAASSGFVVDYQGPDALDRRLRQDYALFERVLQSLGDR